MIIDPMRMNGLSREGLALNTMLSRASFIQQTLDPRRSVDVECGYPESGELGIEMYRSLYDREAVATRVVQVMPSETWNTKPKVYEIEDVETETPFEKAFSNLERSFGKPWFKDEYGCQIWEMLRRVDILSGIGHYGALLLGFDNSGSSLETPVTKVADRKLLFMRAFDESLCQITKYENNSSSPRFGLPVEYNVMFNDNRDFMTGTGVQMASAKVHWSRIVHVADNLGSSEVAGVPRMRPVFNRLLDLRKLYGGSAEMYWKGAFPGISVEVSPDVALAGELSPTEKQGLKDQVRDYMNTLQRYLLISGATAKSLAPQVSDPTAQIEAQITAICIELGIPKRIFTGSERGELASTQDASWWKDQMRSRRTRHATPRIIVPFVDSLISAGVLPEPGEEGYRVVWPDPEELDPMQKAEIASKKTEAIVKYVSGNGEALIDPKDFLTKVVGFSESEADEIVKKTEGLIDDLRSQQDLDAEMKQRKLNASGAVKSVSSKN